MTYEKFKVNYILSWVMLYIGFQISILFMNKSHFYLDDSGNILTADQINATNPLALFSNYMAVFIAIAVIALLWGIYLNLSVAYQRSKYQENQLKLWKITIFSWLTLLVLPWVLIILLSQFQDILKHLITEKVALQIPFMAIAFFMSFQFLGLYLGKKDFSDKTIDN